MGIIANYQYLSDENLNKLKSLYGKEDEVFEKVEDCNEEDKILLDIDKMWDVMHFVLTGVSSDDAVKNSPLSEAVLGECRIEDVEEYISYTEKSRIKDIVVALENFDIDQAMENFSMEECKKANLYPDIWDFEEEADEIEEEIMDYFQNIKDFYNKILESNANVMVSIC